MFTMRKASYALLLVSAILIPTGCSSGKGTESAAGSPSPGASVSPSTSPATTSPTGTASPQPAVHSPSPNTGNGQSAGTPLGMPTAVRLADADSGWIAGAGWIAHTNDGGKNWKNQYNGNATFSQLFALNGKQAWAVSDKAELLGTTDGGSHWTTVGKVPNNGFLHFVSSSEAFAANATTTDGGKTWSTLPVPKDIVGDAYFHDKNNGWAVIQNNGMGIIERTTDGGKTWTNMTGLKLVDPLDGALIRSAGTNDAWIEWIGGSGMSQTSYSLFHTTDGGSHWQTVLANSTAGGGPAPGFPIEYTDGPKNKGSKPGPLYVVDTQTAFMGGMCPACDKSNTIGWTNDGGKTWVNGDAEFPGYAGALLAIADAKHGWWITTDNADPSVMYTTSDGGKTWTKVYSFPRPKQAS